MRKPKRPRSVPREEVQRIIDACGGAVTWDDIIETAPGRFRPNPESVRRIEALIREKHQHRTDIQNEVDDLTHEVIVLEEKQKKIRALYADTWVPGTLLTTWSPPVE